MTGGRLFWSPSSEKDLGKLDPQNRERVRAGMRNFAKTGQGEVKKVEKELRLRIGDFRIFFEVDRAGETITVLRVRRRDKAYR